jgi:hypothetical protein
MGRRPIGIFPMSAAERKRRQREKQTAFAFDRPKRSDEVEKLLRRGAP